MFDRTDPTTYGNPAEIRSGVLCSIEGEALPGGTPPPAPGPAGTPPPPTPPPASDPHKELVAREREAAERQLLKQLGFKSVDEAQAAIKRGKELADANKTELDRLREAASQAEQANAERQTLRGTVERILQTEIEALPEDKRSLVEELGPTQDDPAARLEWLARAKKKGLFAVAPPEPPSPPPGPPPANPANSRAGSGTPPPPSTPQGAPKKRPIEMTAAERVQALALYQAEQAARGRG
jgi:hypothetical protein